MITSSTRACSPLTSFAQDLFGGVALGLLNDTLIAGASGPLSFDGSFRRTWVSWRRNVAGPWLHPVSFFQYVDFSGTDPAQWKLLKVSLSALAILTEYSTLHW